MWRYRMESVTHQLMCRLHRTLERTAMKSWLLRSFSNTRLVKEVEKTPRHVAWCHSTCTASYHFHVDACTYYQDRTCSLNKFNSFAWCKCQSFSFFFFFKHSFLSSSASFCSSASRRWSSVSLIQYFSCIYRWHFDWITIIFNAFNLLYTTRSVCE